MIGHIHLVNIDLILVYSVRHSILSNDFAAGISVVLKVMSRFLSAYQNISSARIKTC